MLYIEEVLLPKIPSFLSKLLFRSFETEESFVNQVAQLRDFAPDRPIAFVLFDAGFIEFSAVRLFFRERFGNTFQLNMGLGISRFWLDFFSQNLSRVATAFHLLPRRNSHVKLCSEELKKGNPIFINFKLNSFNSYDQTPKGEKYLTYLRQEHPKLLVVPVVFVWRRAGRYREETPKDIHTWFLRAISAPLSIPWYFLLGDPYKPRGLRKLILMIRGYSKSMLRLADVIEASESEPRKIRRQSYLSIQTEKRILLGPTYKSTSLLEEQILRNTSFQTFVRSLAAEEEKSEKATLKRATKLLHEMAAKYSYFITEIASWMLGRLFKTIYKGVTYKSQQIEALREDSRQGSIIFVPNHRSYFDFLLLSYLLYKEQFMAPHVIAGINLNFWPVGSFLKRGGAIFIRRSFKGDKLYTEILRRYVNSLLNGRIPFEFFIEGGRSRTGKLAPPRYGILKMVFEAYLKKELKEDVRIVPVSITYDKVTEGTAHKRELEGEKKQKESVANLIRSSSFVFKSFGHVHLRFAKSIPLKDWTRDVARVEKVEELDARFGVQKLAFEICHRINESIPITALGLVCAVLTAKPGAAMAETELIAWLERIKKDVEILGSPLTEEMDKDFIASSRRSLAKLLEEGVAESYELQDGSKGIRIPDKNRVQALYYKNNVIHCFTLPAIVGLAGFIDKSRILRLRDFLEFEFFFSEKEEFFDRIKDLNENLCFSFYSHLIDDILETIETALLLLKKNPKNSWDEKEWINQLMKFGKQRQLESSLLRPESINTQGFKAFINLAQVEGWMKMGADKAHTQIQIDDPNAVEAALEDLSYYRQQVQDWDKVKAAHLK